MTMGRWVRSALVGMFALAAVVAVADPAAADPARPSDDRSEVRSVEPATDAISVEVVGGDGFLHLRVDRGHEVVVEGYEGEPWLHISEDGTVEQNRSSPATYLNADRYAEVTDPNVDPSADPVWEVIGHDGDHVWHDHRIHWMSPDRPTNLRPGDTIYDDWQVPLQVDGQRTVVHGTLVWEHDESPLLWAAVAVAAIAVLVLAARRRSVLVSAIAVTVAAAIAVIVGAGQRAATPAAAGGTALVVIVPAIALVAGIVAIVLHRRPVAVLALLASVAALFAWALLRIQVLLHPVLPTDLPFAFDRLGTALALGTSVAAGYLAVASGALRPADEEPD
jgi:hypothetical protein